MAGAYCLSDGGDGFLEAYEGIVPMRRQRAVVPGPMGNLTVADFLYDEETTTAVIESAQCIGLALIPEDRRDIMAAGTGGLGDMVFGAMMMGARRIVVGLGGSATCDGGLGMLYHLQEGLRRGTKIGRHLGASDLRIPPPVDIPFLRDSLRNVQLDVFCDVKSVLAGPRGTAYTFAPQKGATREQVRELDQMIERWGDYVESSAEPGLKLAEGAGAAGGLGFAFAAIGGKLLPGADTFCNMIGLKEKLVECDGLITCEGRFDGTSFAGKAPWRAAHTSQLAGKPAMIACGIAEQSAIDQANLIGVRVIEFSRDIPESRRTAEAFSLLQEATRRYVLTGR